MHTNAFQNYYATLLDNPQQLMLWGALVLGLLLGGLMQWSRLCLLRGLVNLRQGDQLKLKAFALAMATGLLTSQLLTQWLAVDLSSSVYLQPNPPLPVIFIGGLIFGCGMALANACSGRSLVLCATGNLRALVTLFCVALGAGLTLSGLLAETRVHLENLSRIQLTSNSLPPFLGLLLGLALLIYALYGATLWRSLPDLIGSLLIGTLVAGGWWLTGVVGLDEFEPVRLASLTFIAPLFETQQYLVLATGLRLSFGLILVIGVVAGAWIRALWSRELHWQGFSTTAQLQRSLVGGLLMGIGGVLALGCTYGQMLSGFSTLALASLVAIAGIVAGAWFSLVLMQKKQAKPA